MVTSRFGTNKAYLRKFRRKKKGKILEDNSVTCYKYLKHSSILFHASIQPVHIWDAQTRKLTDFINHFSFVVKTTDPTIYGDGICFFIATVGSQIPPDSSGGFLALFSPNSTYTGFIENQVVAVDHVGINVNSIESVTNAPWIFSSGLVANAWVTYSSSSNTLRVDMIYGSENQAFVGNQGLLYSVDLSEVLSEYAIAGFSDATGAPVEISNILSWEFYSSLEN
ncbi:hypothetical protein P3X46_018550 [Hevea brasiliensis]|uniref:Legume lectin domain-containing protein n=1 Tax=Hevea brasiliensis TaxID=3981 RepID=A0ABQ9LR27_HEVBR|nr:hypothetical protein P3X46_018550 [Hevea brasiliensis]